MNAALPRRPTYDRVHALGLNWLDGKSFARESHPLCPAGENRTAFILASGCSVYGSDLARLPGAACIAVSNTWELKVDAAACYASDREWWVVHVEQVRRWFKGERWRAGQAGHEPHPGVRHVPGLLGSGLCRTAGTIHLGRGAGKNSSLQAMNLALLWGARRLVLVGVDLGGPHYFGDHPPVLAKKRSDYPAFQREIELLVSDLADEGIPVVNCSPVSRIARCTHQPLSEAWP